MLATIVLLERPMKFTLMALKPEGHDICILDLLHGCDNMISGLANEAKLALLLFLPMMLKSGCQVN